MKKEKTIVPTHQARVSFGSTSAIITNLALISGMNHLPGSRISIISGILIIALADNVSDSFGIHIFQESERLDTRENWLTTLTNFFSRLVVSLVFVAIVYLLPIQLAFLCAVVWGLIVLMVISFMIARSRKKHPAGIIFEHLFLLIIVIFLSTIIGDWTQHHFGY